MCARRRWRSGCGNSGRKPPCYTPLESRSVEVGYVQYVNIAEDRGLEPDPRGLRRVNTYRVEPEMVPECESLLKKEVMAAYKKESGHPVAGRLQDCDSRRRQ